MKYAGYNAVQRVSLPSTKNASSSPPAMWQVAGCLQDINRIPACNVFKQHCCKQPVTYKKKINNSSSQGNTSGRSCDLTDMHKICWPQLNSTEDKQNSSRVK